ncbi:MAG: peptide chain release factor 2 [Candidatus Neomarinimicrobiota bacterium]|nr:peptide chain release factor 2 [Candidatus Neomarinimicrobiota bacterium]RKY47788.1 MAG: peptide chain release factor 2 [Candidatus Neomarinimicrobiota bacterium]
MFDLPHKEKELEELRKESQREEVWSDVQRYRKVTERISYLEGLISEFKELEKLYNDVSELSSLLEEAPDDSLYPELRQMLVDLVKKLETVEIKNVLSDEDDVKNAILTIHPGAGGTESQDWAEMLLRMYLKWAERSGMEAKIVDIQDGEEAGIKDATIEIRGKYAYGYLKTEVGIHRLIRISPFDANRRRHTSFASVFVYPEIEEDIEIEIKPEELRIDTFRASGHGGQHVNKTDSAVRITHLPTGIVVQCQNERSQHKNKAMALKILKSRLYQLKKEEQEKTKQEYEKQKKDISWGNQIRTYVFHPYRMVKDHRTKLEKGNVEEVLNGDIDDFIRAVLFNYSREEG